MIFHDHPGNRMHRALSSTMLTLAATLIAVITVAAPASADQAPDVTDVTPYVVAPDPGGNYTPLKRPGGWTGYDSQQTLSVQLSSTGTFAWGDVIQPSWRSIIIGNVTASGSVFKNGKKVCDYSKVEGAGYSFHASCPWNFAKTDLIIFNLTYTFSCIRAGNPCSIIVTKAFNVT